jgi:hypothetical protein
MMRKFFIFLIVLLLLSGGTAGLAEEKEEPIEKVCENVFFQKSAIEDYGSLYFRGKLLGYELLPGIAAAAHEIEGVVYFQPTPYVANISKSPIYTWEEILDGVKGVVADVLKRHGEKFLDSAKPKLGS